MESCKYTYRAVVISVYDGDTLTADIDCGFGIWLNRQHFRLYGINTPEMRGPTKEKAIVARDALRHLVDGREITIRAHKDVKEKFGRFLAEIYVNGADGNEIYVNQHMIQQGHAVPFMADQE